MNIGKIRGVNLGGWLLMEGYILGGLNIPQREFRKKFIKLYGIKEWDKFIKYFRDSFIQEEDIRTIAQWGFKYLRVPFHYNLLEEEKEDYLERVINWAKKYNIEVILDLHATYGSQNCDWHSDSLGRALLWEEEKYRNKTINLWEKIADRFKNNTTVLGYDLLNEPVIDKNRIDVLKSFYKCLVKSIKSIDKKHIIFLEGNFWATDVNFIEEIIEENVHVSVHYYMPLDYTFNFVPFFTYPGKINNILWDKDRIYKSLYNYYLFASKNKVGIWIGEFGINYRGNKWGEMQYLKNLLEVFREFNFGWTYWTYKSIAGCCFPDGLYQYIPNHKYVNRQGPIKGWENFLIYWQKEKEEIKDFFLTKNYTINKDILHILRSYL